MSRDPRDYARPSHPSSSYPNLPPIRDVFGDYLEPLRPRSAPQATGHASGKYNTHRDSTGRPIHADPSRRQQNATVARNAPNSQHYYSQGQYGSQQRDRVGTPSHSYDVFTTTNQGLVHQRSSDKDDFRQTAKEEAISMSTGRHVCPECRRRFEKLSHYKNHLNSHSGEKPYQCPWPGCGKTFTASSNMRRHERGHTGSTDDGRKHVVHHSEATQSSRWGGYEGHVDSKSFYH